MQQRPTPPEGVTITNPTDKMVSVKKKNFSCILYSTYIHVSNLQSAARNQFEIDLQGNIFFTPFQYISSTLSNLVHTGLHTQQSTFRSLAEGLFSAATPRVILVVLILTMTVGGYDRAFIYICLPQRYHILTRLLNLCLTNQTILQLYL